MSRVPHSGAVDAPVFSMRVDDEIHAGSYDRLVVAQNDAARRNAARSLDGDPEAPWVGVRLPDFGAGGDPVALCPGGMIVSADSGSTGGGSASTVSGTRAPQR